MQTTDSITTDSMMNSMRMTVSIPMTVSTRNSMQTTVNTRMTDNMTNSMRMTVSIPMTVSMTGSMRSSTPMTGNMRTRRQSA